MDQVSGYWQRLSDIARPYQVRVLLGVFDRVPHVSEAVEQFALSLGDDQWFADPGQRSCRSCVE